MEMERRDEVRPIPEPTQAEIEAAEQKYFADTARPMSEEPDAMEAAIAGPPRGGPAELYDLLSWAAFDLAEFHLMHFSRIEDRPWCAHGTRKDGNGFQAARQSTAIESLRMLKQIVS